MNGVEMTLEGIGLVCHFRLAEDGRNEGDEFVDQSRYVSKRFILTALFHFFHFSNCLSSAFFYQFFFSKISFLSLKNRRSAIVLIVCDTTLGFGKTPSF
ncbi:hypothetical protein GHT06_015218 [Daphnia sinensis]|uniref:Uncharacterized protein n=1 Tax=Daphnia sinensis TaxID=1820382 RepID=A0AAD5PVX3_9CRUS|nr:hypothetical protein GHT06_015218 [Daphnia sinensis]